MLSNLETSELEVPIVIGINLHIYIYIYIIHKYCCYGTYDFFIKPDLHLCTTKLLYI